MKKELRLVITRDCNYNCYFCHGEGIDKKCRPLLTPDDYAFLVKECKDNFNWDSVTLTGGEPFVRKDCKEIVEKLNLIGMKTTIVSNGELISENYDCFDKIERLNISIHTLNEEKYNQIIQRKDKLKKVLKNLSELRNRFKNLDIRINTTIVKNQNDDSESFDELIKLAENLNASIKIIELFSENKDEIIKLTDIQEILFSKGFKLKKQDLFKNTLTNGKIDIILSKIFCAMANEYYEPGTFCNANNDIFITPDGKIKMCRNSNATINILEEIKNRDAKSLKEKFDLANNVLGKACPFFLKSRMQELAILGGKPLIENNEGKFIHPKITQNIVDEVTAQLKDTISIYNDSNIFKEFESNFCKYHNKKYGLVTSSGTAALHSLFDSINLKKGDEVICPIYTFYATVSPIFQTGATPIFVDCDETGNIDYTKIEEKITKKTKAIMVVHMWGYPAKMDEIRKIANKYDLYLFEDCSHAHGGSYKDKHLGEWGDAAAFSLQGNKIITGGEGGILITNDKSIYKNALLLGHYNKRCKQEIDKDSTDYKYAVTGKGLKLRAHPLAIRIANTMFKDLNNIHRFKKCYSEMFQQCIDEIDGLSYVIPYEDSDCAYYAFILNFDESKFKVNKEDFVKALIAEGCVEADIPNSTTVLSKFPLFTSPEYFFPSYNGIKIKGSFENAEKFDKEIIKLPVWYTEEDWLIVYKYCEAIKKVANYYRR